MRAMSAMIDKMQRTIIAITSFDTVVYCKILLPSIVKYFSSDSIIQIIIKNLISYYFLCTKENTYTHNTKSFSVDLKKNCGFRKSFVMAIQIFLLIKYSKICFDLFKISWLFYKDLND